MHYVKPLKCCAVALLAVLHVGRLHRIADDLAKCLLAMNETDSPPSSAEKTLESAAAEHNGLLPAAWPPGRFAKVHTDARRCLTDANIVDTDRYFVAHVVRQGFFSGTAKR